jgi:hypothetical protein
MVGEGGEEFAMVVDDGADPESGRLAGMASFVDVSIGADWLAESERRVY